MPSSRYGRRLIPQILDSLASVEPDRVVYSIAASSDLSQGCEDITARAFARAVDKTAWWLRGLVGKPSSIRAVGYIGPRRFMGLPLDLEALFLSPKNSTEAALAVLEATACQDWVKPCEQPLLPLVEDIMRHRSMRVLELPGCNDLLDATFNKPFWYHKGFDEASREPFCVLHTSGSTGLPKPVPWSNGLIGTMDAVRLLPSVQGDHGLAPWTSNWNEGDTIYSSFPMSHGAGIIMSILMPSLFKLRCVLGPAGIIPNMDLINSLADYSEIDIWSMVPSLVDELGDAPDVLSKLKSSKFICASGGPLTPSSASKVNDVVRILNLTGTTEGLFIGNLWVNKEDWLYFAFHPFSGFEFREVEPGVFEHWVLRNDHWPLFQGIFHTLPEQRSINLKDLYVKHPSNPDLWAFKGRTDEVVVLSNGYKISPFDTEALITTHPAVIGCLMVGTGKPQASLLVELKNPNVKSNDLFDSIWEKIEAANKLSLHKDQLQKDYVTFAEPDKAFIRTDKGTIKRRATLAFYADHIERFYESRSQEPDANLSMTIDTSSVEAVTIAVRKVFGSLLPSPKDLALEEDVFKAGLDSLLAYRAIKTLRVATTLQDRLSPRHLYAHPTLAGLSDTITSLAATARKAQGRASDESSPDVGVKRLIAKHKARLSQKVNPFDLMNPNIYVGLNFFFQLRKSADYEEAFARLQEGLRRTTELVPTLAGKIIACSEHEVGFKKGDLRISLPEIPSTSDTNFSNHCTGERQLAFKNLSDHLPSYRDLRMGSFLSSAFKDDLVLDAPWFPPFPADIMIAQANFVDGGCILATNFHHACFDGVGVMTVMRLWAENCRYVQGDTSATCGWLDPESLNRSLPGVLYEFEGYSRPAHEVDHAVWGFLGFSNPAEMQDANGTTSREELPMLKQNGTVEPALRAPSNLPPAPHFPRKFAWPPEPPKDGRYLHPTTFLVSAGNVQKLVAETSASTDVDSPITSVNDIIQAFFWRAATRARYHVAQHKHSHSIAATDQAILELIIDARPFFSANLPSTYMGNLLVVNRPAMSVTHLCAPNTSLASIAAHIRAAAARITTPLVHDAFALLRSVPDYSKLTNACMGLEGMHAMLNNLLLFDTSDIAFGNEFFADGGQPEAVRIQMDRFMTAFRLLVILPMRRDGGVELLLGTLPEELEALKSDAEFVRFATLLG